MALTVQSDGRGAFPSSDASQPGDADPTIVAVGPSSRLAWEQPQREHDVEVERLGFWLVVDGELRRLTGVVCGERNDDYVPCEAPIPALDPGPRTIAVTASVQDDGDALQDQAQRAESDTFTVVVTDKDGGLPGVAPPGDDPPSDDLPPDDGGRGDRTKDMGVSAGAGRLATVRDGFDDAVDLALLPDGQRALVAERSGTVHLVDLATARSQAIAVPAPELVRGDGRGVLSVAVAGDFDRSGLVYVLYSTARGVDLARFRLIEGTLGERLIVAADVPSRTVQPAAVVRQSPDGHLLVAVDDAMAPPRADDFGDLAGKLLGLNADGTTPRSQTSIVLAGGLQQPRAVVATNGGVWVVDRRADAVTTALRWVPVRGSGATTSVTLPGQARAAAAIPASGGAADDLVLVASEDGRLRRVRLVGGSEAASIEVVNGTSWPGVVALAVRADGVAYGLTGTALLGFGGVR